MRSIGQSRRSFIGLLMLSTLLLITLAAPVWAQSPPIIDRELFFGDPEIAGAQISPDGAFIAFIKPFKGTRNVWVKKTADPFTSAKPITADTKRPIPDLLLVARWQVHPLRAGQGRRRELQRLRRESGGRARFRTRRAGRAKSHRRKRHPGLYLCRASQRARRDLRRYKRSRCRLARSLQSKNLHRRAHAACARTPNASLPSIFDLKDQLRLATRSAENGDTEVLRVDADKFTKIYSCNVFESCGPIRYHKDGERVYFQTNKGSDVDLVRLELFNPATGKEELVESDPLKRVDFGNAIFSEVSDELIATTYDDERERIYWKDKGFEADYKNLQKQLPGKEIGFGSSTKDEKLWIVAANADTDPGATYLFDRTTKKLTLQYQLREKLNRSYLAPMKPVKYPSSDGLEIPAYLTLPKGVEAKNLPAVIVPHGGPWYRDSWGYNAFAQFLANRGYAVLQPNFRGSTGYGKKFIDAGKQAVGRQDAGRRHLGCEVSHRSGHCRSEEALASWVDPTAVTLRSRELPLHLTFMRPESRLLDHQI